MAQPAVPAEPWVAEEENRGGPTGRDSWRRLTQSAGISPRWGFCCLTFL